MMPLVAGSQVQRSPLRDAISNEWLTKGESLGSMGMLAFLKKILLGQSDNRAGGDILSLASTERHGPSTLESRSAVVA